MKNRGPEKRERALIKVIRDDPLIMAPEDPQPIRSAEQPPAFSGPVEQQIKETSITKRNFVT